MCHATIHPTAQELIRRFRLEPHPEGGYYQRIFESDYGIQECARDVKSQQLVKWEKTCLPRPLCTSIYYLLEGNQRSHLHQIPCEELWYHLAGDCITIVSLDNQGNLSERKLGPPAFPDAEPFVLVKAGEWFGARTDQNCEYAFVSCVVVGSFFFEEFRLANRAELVQQFPQHELFLMEMCLV
jgi:predicted cupin superfamily sugar epimerase